MRNASATGTRGIRLFKDFQERDRVDDPRSSVLAKHEEVIVLADEEVDAGRFGGGEELIVLWVSRCGWYVAHAHHLGIGEDRKDRFLVPAQHETELPAQDRTFENLQDFVQHRPRHDRPVPIAMVEDEGAPTTSRIERASDKDDGVENDPNHA